MLSGFRFTHPVELRFRDMDALGHVNNVVFHYDYAARRSTPVPAELRRQILAQDPEARELSAERG